MLRGESDLTRSRTFAYDRNRLHTATTGAIVARYNYDPSGRLDEGHILL